MAVIPQTAIASGRLRPQEPPTRALPWTRWDLKRSPDPSPTHAPLTTNPGSAPGSSHLQFILHLNKITECLKMTTFKIVLTFDGGFLVLKPHALQGDMYFI